MAVNFLIVENNTAPDYQITCTRDGTAIDLTGASVEVILQQKSTGTITNTTNQTATLSDASNGIITWTAISTDFPDAGTYVADIKITYSGGGVEILYEQAKWKVRSKIE